jgi:hypothetical protein
MSRWQPRSFGSVEDSSKVDSFESLVSVSLVTVRLLSSGHESSSRLGGVELSFAPGECGCGRVLLVFLVLFSSRFFY